MFSLNVNKDIKIPVETLIFYTISYTAIFLFKGASSGIGAATAVLFAKLGARLSLTGRNEENLAKIGQQCADQPGAHKVDDNSCLISKIYIRIGICL